MYMYIVKYCVCIYKLNSEIPTSKYNYIADFKL